MLCLQTKDVQLLLMLDGECLCGFSRMIFHVNLCLFMSLINVSMVEWIFFMNEFAKHVDHLNDINGILLHV